MAGLPAVPLSTVTSTTRRKPWREAVAITACRRPSSPTTRRAALIREAMAEITTQPFDVVVNPEFMKEGAAIDDFMRPDRILIGCNDVRVLEIMKELYAPFLRTGKPILTMSLRSAEMTK